MGRLPLAFLAACALGGAVATAWAGKAHEHGVARLDLAVEAGRLTLALDAPLDSLLGFERAPRTEAERERVASMVARLRDAGSLFRIDSAAGCTLAKVELVSAPLGLGPAPGLGSTGAPAKEGHGDLEGHFEFSCKAGARAGFVEVGLFEAFAPLRRVELQVVTPKGQMKATLVRPASRVALVR
ncbi:MAG: DUF2796 domain-containing protein [Rubrivivax sp.]|nr:DUF2796 domain-containing protein [Rubrivivax sp.]